MRATSANCALTSAIAASAFGTDDDVGELDGADEGDGIGVGKIALGDEQETRNLKNRNTKELERNESRERGTARCFFIMLVHKSTCRHRV